MRSVPDRRGKPVYFTVDYDTVALLEAMVPQPRSRGALFSELIRREARERAAREEMVQALTAARAGRGGDSDETRLPPHVEKAGPPLWHPAPSRLINPDAVR